MVAVYSGNLIAFMTVHKRKIPVNSLDDLAAQPEYQAGVLKGGSLQERFEVRGGRSNPTLY